MKKFLIVKKKKMNKINNYNFWIEADFKEELYNVFNLETNLYEVLNISIYKIMLNPKLLIVGKY